MQDKQWYVCESGGYEDKKDYFFFFRELRVLKEKRKILKGKKTVGKNKQN